MIYGHVLELGGFITGMSCPSSGRGQGLKVHSLFSL